MLQEYQVVYRMLEDNESRDIYLNRINYLITNDYKYIRNIVTAYLPGFLPLNGKTLDDFRNELPKDRKIVLYGAGVFAEETLERWKNDSRFIGFCSGTKEKQVQGYLGYPVMSPEELLARKDLNVVINTRRAYTEIREILERGGYPQNQVFSMAEIIGMEDTEQYFNPDFMRYEDEEVFVDVGCFDLYTSIRLKKYCKSVKKVYAFEPDAQNYQRCLERKRKTGFQEVELLPYGAWNERTTLYFHTNALSASSVSESGESSISVIPIDEAIAEGDRVTFIKMDVEGSELESLKGAKRIIQRDKPKLAICIYHKLEDMTEIPLYIKGLVPEYRLFIRHHSNTQAETVLYAVMP